MPDATDSDTRESGAGTVGERAAGPVTITVVVAYLILLSAGVLFGLVEFWSPPGKSDNDSPAVYTVTLVGADFEVSAEVRLLVIVALAGALGGLIHSCRSVIWYVGNRDLRRSWTVKYVLQPFVGSALGLVFYFVVRAGFFTPQGQGQPASPYGFAALAGLAGMFSEQVVLKLKQVVENLFARSEIGANHVDAAERKE